MIFRPYLLPSIYTIFFPFFCCWRDLAIFRGLIIGPAPPEGILSRDPEAASRRFAARRGLRARSPLLWGYAGPIINVLRKKTRCHLPGSAQKYFRKILPGGTPPPAATMLPTLLIGWGSFGTPCIRHCGHFWRSHFHLRYQSSKFNWRLWLLIYPC